MEIIDKFNNLIEEEKYAEALPVIYDIIDMNPDISTSWFNLGICLQNLEDYPQGAGAFQQACFRYEHENDWDGYGASQFRVAICLNRAGMQDELFHFFKDILAEDPSMIEVLSSTEEFIPLFNAKPFSDLLPKNDNA